MNKLTFLLLLSLVIVQMNSAVITKTKKTQQTVNLKSNSASQNAATTADTTPIPSTNQPTSIYDSMSADDLNKMIADILLKLNSTKTTSSTNPPASLPKSTTTTSTTTTTSSKNTQTFKTADPIPTQITPEVVSQIIDPVVDPTITDSTTIDQTINNDLGAFTQENNSTAGDLNLNNETNITEIVSGKTDVVNDTQLVNAPINETVKSNNANTSAPPKATIIDALNATELMSTNSTTIPGYSPPENVGLCKDDSECQLNYHDFIVAGLKIACNPKIGVCEPV